MVKPLKELGFVSVGMVITDINGVESVITGIKIPSKPELENITEAEIPQGTDLILKLDVARSGHEEYLFTDMGWEFLDEKILVVNEEEFQTPNLIEMLKASEKSKKTNKKLKEIENDINRHFYIQGSLLN